ncbi:filament-forming protein [Coccidioides immitis RS]|uniref:Filament-forming protein n=1 Tax=Coccidioides immitis (strain RS) TaxID=246410 RepID=J3KJP3_COCIM|nr:filament-forming protein [Coccidioides immitis RS]EAS36318.3 filament-forming protein [Coccidioides immitis RS]
MATAAVDIPFLSSHYSIPQATLTTLTENPTVDLVGQLLKGIAAKARETEELKSDKLRLEVEFENTVRGNEAKVKVLKSSVEKGHAEILSLRNKLQETENVRSELESKLEALKSSASNNEAEFNSLKTRIASLEASNRDTLGLLESKSAAYDKLAEELSAQHRKTVTLRREVADLEQKLQAANSASASTRFREQSLQQELDLLKKNNEWFENELQTKSAEYLKFRKEKAARISELQRQNEETNSNIDTLRRNETSLKQRLDEVEQKYEESLTSVQYLKEEAIKQTESFRIELDSAGRLAQLQQNAAETAKKRVQECQLALEKAKDDAAQELSRLRAEIETEHSDKEAAERRVAELELAVKQLESEVASGRNQPSTPMRGLNGGISTPLRPSTPVGSFSPRSARTKGGLTLTQMYTEYDKMRTLLAAEQKNNQELKTAMDEMVQDLESSKPEIDELRADHSRLEASVIEMSGLLDAASKEREEATREARKWQGHVEGLEGEGNILRQQLRDLSAQVKVLVMEVHLLGSGEKDYNRDELEKIASEGIDETADNMNNTGRFITRHMTTFKNLNELQTQNVTLRRMLRELGDKLEGEEARKRDLSYQKDQDELKELRSRVQTYRDEMASLVAQTKSYIKERDTFRSMLLRRREIGETTSPFSQSLPLGAVPPSLDSAPAQPSEGPDYAELLRKLQAHFDSFRQETATDHSSLKQQVNDLTRKNGELQSEISRSNSQLTTSIQRAELLQSNFNMLKNENIELQKRHSILMENANKQDLRTQQVAEDLVEARGLVDSLRRETANLKAEKELWKSIEKRLVEDNESLRNERSRLDTLNANLQSMLNEREHTESETRRRLQSTIESLESELQSTKRKLSDETEDAKKLALRREFDQEQTQKRIEDLVTSLGSIREELVATKTSKDHLQSRVDELSVELKSAEERLVVLQRKPSAAPASTTAAEEAPEAGEGTGLSREQELAVEVSELKRDLELARSELTHAQEQAEDYKAISQATEERLQALNDTNEQYREDTDRLLEEKNSTISELEKRVEDLSTELAASNGELSKLRDQEAQYQRRLDDQKSTMDAEITRLKEQQERYEAAAQFHQQDLKAQAEIAQNAQQNYENELVKHAEAAKHLQTVRAEANQLKLEAVDLKTQAESAKSNLTREEENWNEMKGRYEKEIEELSRRREEVLSQNTILHGQLESITKQISSLQRDRAGIPEDGETETASGSDLEGLQEVIKFLRREKEIVDVQYHLSTQESKRLRQQLDYTQTQLEDTRLKLEQQRRAEAESEQHALSHNKLLETLNELNLFRESSVTLRNQVKQLEASVDEKAKLTDELQQQIEPLQTRIRELEDNLETKDGEMKLLQSDRDRWQQRTQNILQKYDRVDPAELEAMKEKLETLKKERDEAVSARETLEAQASTFPEQLKQAEDRTQELRTRLTEQFKARSKELTGRINAKQLELNSVIQEKEQINQELDRAREELNLMKSRPPETVAAAPVTQDTIESQPPNAPPPEAANSGDVNASEEKIKELEEKVRQLEAALAAKEAEIDQKVKERVDRMKEILQSKLAEHRASSQKEVEALKAAHQQELASKAEGIPVLSDAAARELVAKNETIRNIIKNNIRNAINKEKEAMGNKEGQAQRDMEAMKELEKKFNEEKENILKERDQKISSAVELAEKRLLAKVSMTEGRARNAQAKIEVVQKAASDTPQRPVAEVWEIAKAAKPVVAQQAAPKPLPPASPAPPASAPAQSPAPTAPATPSQQKVTPTQTLMPTPQQPAEHPPPTAKSTTHQPEQQQLQQPQPAATAATADQAPTQQATGLPNRPPQAAQPVAGAGVLRALQSGLPVARGGRGRGMQGGPQHGQFVSDQQMQGQQFQQQHAGRGSAISRGRGMRGGGQGRGGAQHIQTGNLPQGAGQASPRGGRGGLNAQARQFIPHGKRARDDGGDADANAGKRMRGGGAGQ